MADPWAEFTSDAPATAPAPISRSVFIPAPGAAKKEAREEAGETRADISLGNEATRIGLSREDNARQDRQEVFGNATTLRKEFHSSPEYKNYETVIRQFSSALKTAATPTGDQALITAYAKMLDPGSVVREQEFNVVAAGDSSIGQAIARLGKELGLDEAGMLRPEVRARVRREMLNLTADYRRSYEKTRKDYGDIALRNGINLDDAIGTHLGEAYRDEIEKGWLAANSLGAQSGGTGTLRVAEGETYSTEQDQANARRLQEAWNKGSTPEQINALAIELTGKPLAPEDMEKLRRGGTINFAPASSGRREAGEQIDDGLVGQIQSAAAGSVRGYLANMPEELGAALGMDPNQIKTALDAYQKKNPVANFVGEIGGSVLSPAAKVIKGGKAAQIASDAVYGGIYGAGEADPGASLEERALGAGVGAVTGGAGSAVASKFLGPKAGAVVEEVAPGAPARAAEGATEEAVKEGVEEVADSAQIVQLARQAVGRGPGTAKAKRELAELAKANPEAKLAAERLGVELPVDILSDSAQLKSLTGMARSQVGSEAETAWKNKFLEVQTKADEAVEGLGASRDLAQASDDVFQRLNSSMESLQRQGDELRREVDDAIDVRERVGATSLQGVIGELINDMGGLKEAKQAMTGEERKLLAMLGEGENAVKPTYARLNQMRDQIGRALNKNEGPWADAPRSNLAKYYAALADDQIAHIEATAGTEIADKMRASNTLFKQMYDARADMQEVFGRDLDKSLAPLLNRALTQGGKGDAQALNKLISRFPEDMRGPLLASGILAQAQGKGAQGGFSFANYAKAYRGLRENKPIYQQIAKAVGPDGDRILADLYAISRRMVDADGNVLRTGKANQALLALNAERLASRVMKGTAARMVGTVGAGAVGGPVAGGLAMATQELLTKGGKARSDKVHALLSSPEFRALIENLGSEGEAGAINKLAASKPFATYLPANLTDRRAWINSTLAVGSTSALPETPTIEIGTAQ